MRWLVSDSVKLIIAKRQMTHAPFSCRSPCYHQTIKLSSFTLQCTQAPTVHSPLEWVAASPPARQCRPFVPSLCGRSYICAGVRPPWLNSASSPARACQSADVSAACSGAPTEDLPRRASVNQTTAGRCALADSWTSKRTHSSWQLVAANDCRIRRAATSPAVGDACYDQLLPQQQHATNTCPSVRPSVCLIVSWRCLAEPRTPMCSWRHSAFISCWSAILSAILAAINTLLKIV